MIRQRIFLLVERPDGFRTWTECEKGVLQAESLKQKAIEAGFSAFIAFGEEVRVDVRPNGGASAIASDLVARSRSAKLRR